MSALGVRSRVSVTAFQSASNCNRLSRFHRNVAPARLTSKRTVVVRAQAAEDDDFEKRLASLKKVKRPQTKKAETAAAVPPKEKKYDFSNEVVFFEGSPSTGDVVTNVALGATLVWLPLSFAAIGRKAFVNYKVTDKRVVVTSTLPWKTETAFVAYEDVKDVVAIARGLGFWGDMVVTKKNGEKLEIRAIDKWDEIRDYIKQQTAAAQPSLDINPLEDDLTSEYRTSAASRKGFQ